MFVVLMGAPGAGKGTQAKLLQNQIGLPQVATGDIFRENLKNETELGMLAKGYMDAGDLVPDDVTVAMVKDRLSREDCANGAILDGFPRTVAQAEALDNVLAEAGSKVDIVPHIFVEEEELVSRLIKRGEIEGRADDNEETIRNRMRVYHDQTAPLLSYYDGRGLVEKIDGQQSVSEVNVDLLARVARASIHNSD